MSSAAHRFGAGRLIGHTVEPIMPWRCTELSKLTSPSLWNLTMDLVARFSQTFFTRASFHRGEEVWLKSFNFKSFFALKIVILYFKTQLSAWNRSIFFLQDLSSRFELAYSALDSVRRAALVGHTVPADRYQSVRTAYEEDYVTSLLNDATSQAKKQHSNVFTFIFGYTVEMGIPK